MPDNTRNDNERPTVLVVNDEPAVIRMLSLELSLQGFDVVGANVGDDTYRSYEKFRPDVVVLDVILPGVSGYEVMRRLKQRYNARVIFITAQGGDADRDYAIELGADDFIHKPFSPEELSRRINLVLDRDESPARHVARFNGLEIDFDRRIVRRDGQNVAMGTNEWALLFAMARHGRNRVAPRDLLIGVWGGEYASDLRFLEIWIARLRQKLEQDPDGPRVIVGDVEGGFGFGSTASGRLSA